MLYIETLLVTDYRNTLVPIQQLGAQNIAEYTYKHKSITLKYNHINLYHLDSEG